MSSVVISGDVSGSVTLQAPSAAGTTVLTLPATSGTVVTTATSTGISGSAITTGTVATNVGGTGITSFTSGGAMYATSTSALTTGILPVASGGTGTATPSLVGGTNITISGSWPNQTVTAAGGAPTTAQVLSATAGASVDEVGTYAWLGNTSSGTGYSPGSNYAGSGLAMAGMSGTVNDAYATTNTYTLKQDYSGGARSGTWKAMGGSNQSSAGSDRPRSTLFLRVS